MIIASLQLLLSLPGCAPAPPAFCDNPELRYDYAPEGARGLTTYPDDHWTEPDDSTGTGLRVAMHPDQTDAFDDYPENYVEWFDFLSTLDGFGLTSGVAMQFTQGLPDPLSPDDVVLAALTQDGPVLHEAELLQYDSASTLIIRPRVSLPPATRVVALLRTDPNDAECLNPGKHLSALLDPTLDAPPAMAERFQQDLAALEIPPEQVGAMTTFTTQSALDASLEVVDDIAGRDYSVEQLSCEDRVGYRQCEGEVEVWDYRTEDLLVPPGPVQARSSYRLPLRLWIPPEDGAPGPWPVLLCGHGLGGDRGQCGAVQPHGAELGVAVAAVDAVEHGDHPARSEAALELLEPLMIFAMRIDPPGIDGLRLRDNFRQSTWDRLQVLKALRSGVDIDGDGSSELDGSRTGYIGVSLGGIMGPQTLALDPELLGGWLVVGGGRVTQIIQDSPSFSVLIDLMAPSHYSEGDVAQAFPLLQTMMDPGDPMVWGPYVQQQRLVGERAPDIFAAAAYMDEIVPNTNNNLLIQSMGLPGVGQEIWPVWQTEFEPGPVSGNMSGGATGGFVQFDTVTRSGEERDAEHSGVHRSDQGLQALDDFFFPMMFEGGRGVINTPDLQ